MYNFDEFQLCNTSRYSVRNVDSVCKPRYSYPWKAPATESCNRNVINIKIELKLKTQIV